MSRLNVRRVGYALGAEVTGVDLSGGLDDALAREIRKAWLENIVLCFPGQDLGPDELKAFCSRFGELDDFRGSPQHRDASDSTVRTISNQPAGTFPYGQLWHSDRQFTNRPASGTFLVAKDLPDVGGDTMFANMYAAYDALSPAMQHLVGSLSSVHDISAMPLFDRKTPEQQATQQRLNPPLVHPLVRSHPETGRKSLFLGGSLRNFKGMTAEESAPLKEFLMRHATRYEFLYVHRWRPHDLVMWDNRCTMHYAVPNYDRRQLRRMLRCALLGAESGSYLGDGRESEHSPALA